MFDLKKLQRIALQMVNTEFQQSWDWIVEFHGNNINPPRDFDLYCRQIEHGGISIEHDEKQVGSVTFSTPSHRTAGEITLQIKDNNDARCERFFKSLASRVVNPDGTVNLPTDYLFDLYLYRFGKDNQKTLYRQWRVSCKSYEGFSRDRSATGEYVSHTVTFQKHASNNR